MGRGMVIFGLFLITRRIDSDLAKIHGNLCREMHLKAPAIGGNTN